MPSAATLLLYIHIDDDMDRDERCRYYYIDHKGANGAGRGAFLSESLDLVDGKCYDNCDSNVRQSLDNLIELLETTGCDDGWCIMNEGSTTEVPPQLSVRRVVTVTSLAKGVGG